MALPLRRIYAELAMQGRRPAVRPAVRAFVELHVERGPVLEAEEITIGAVEGVQGISWSEYTITGVSNHAGTTPMRLRHDAGYAAGAVIRFVRELASLVASLASPTLSRKPFFRLNSVRHSGKTPK